MSPLLFVLAAFLLLLAPIAPKLLRIRVRILRWLRWNWGADLIENHFAGWVLSIRIVLVAVAAVLLYAGWTGVGG